jgi:cysteine desulfurase/selenocysteine lyase
MLDKSTQLQAGSYDVESIRADFPILSRHVYEDTPLVYLDNGASAQKPYVVVDAVKAAYESEYANVHRGLHFLSNLATENYEAARETVRQFVNAASVEEIIFTKNATEALNLVSQSFAGEILSEGDEIVLSIMEHHSNIVPWHFHRERSGVVLKWAPVSEEGVFDVEAFESLLTPKTKIVAITHMSNVLGTIMPIKEIVSLAHDRDIAVVVDGSQGAVHLPVDVQDLGADFYVFTGHKLYGPSGIGVLYGRKEHLKKMPPYQGGGEMISEVFTDRVTYGEPPEKFEAGTPPIVQAIGLAAAIDYVESVGRDAIYVHERELALYAQERLSELSYIRLLGNAPEKGAIFSFVMEGAHAHDVSTIIDRFGIAVRAGTHCAEPLLAHFGVTSTCRASFGLYNTKSEVDALVVALTKAKEFFA